MSPSRKPPEDPWANVRPRPSPGRQQYLPEDEQDPHRTITGVYRVVDDHWSKITKALVLVGAVGAGVLSVMGLASAQTDAGMRVVKDRQNNLVLEVQNQKAETQAKWLATERRLDRQEERVEVVNKKIDLLLDAARVPAYKRPDEPAKDGGK